jgi:hypothetical protein
MTHFLPMTRSRLLVALAAVVLLGVIAQSALVGVTGAVMYLTPPLVLLLVLAARCYPGEQALRAVLGAGRHARRRVDALAVVRRPRPHGLVPRGGLLIASSLAVRPPPALGPVFLS